MDIQMNEFLERQRVVEEQRRISITIQDLRLRQVVVDKSKQHAVRSEQVMERDLHPVKMQFNLMREICQNLEQKEQMLIHAYSMVNGDDFHPRIVDLKLQASENEIRNKNVTIEKRKAMIKRAQETLQRDPKVRQVNAVLQSIENSKAQLNELGDLINQEEAQIQNDEQKDQNAIKFEEKCIRDLEENIRCTEQQLQQENEKQNPKSEGKLEISPQKSVTESTVSIVRPKTPAKLQFEEEDFSISPIKMFEPDLSGRKKRNATAAGPSNVQNNRAHCSGLSLGLSSGYRALDALQTMQNSPNVVQNNRTQGHGTGNSHHMMGNVPPQKRPAIGSQHLDAQNLSATVNDPGIRTMTPKPSTVDKKAENMPISNHSVRQNQQNDQTNSHATKPTPAKQNVPTAAPSNLQNNGHRGPASGSGNGYRAHDESQMMMNAPSMVQNNRTHGNGSGNNRRSSPTAMMNVPYYAGYDNAFSGAQNLPTATNDTRLPPKTPTPPIADNKDDDMVISPIKMSDPDASFRKRVLNITKPTSANQNPSAAGPSKVQNNGNRAYGSSSNSNYRAPDATQMMANAPNNVRNNRVSGPASAVKSNVPNSATQFEHGNQYPAAQNLSVTVNDPGIRTIAPKPPVTENENRKNDHTKSHATVPLPATQNTSTTGPNTVQNNGSRRQLDFSGNGYHAPDASQMMANAPNNVRNNRLHAPSGLAPAMVSNAPYNAMQLGHGNQYSGVQNLLTAPNDSRLRSETPKPAVAEDKNHQNDHTKPHDVNPTPANQFASTVGSNNMQNNDGQGSGSGSSYRAPDPSNMVNNPHTAKSKPADGRSSGLQKPSTALNEPSMRYGISFGDISFKDMSTDRSMRRVAQSKPTEPNSTSTAPKKMATAPSSGDPFVQPTAPPPNAQKRKSEPDQATDTKKSRAVQFAENNSHGEWSGNAGSNPNAGQSSDNRSELSFDFNDFDEDIGGSFGALKYDGSSNENSQKGNRNGIVDMDFQSDFSFSNVSASDFTYEGAGSGGRGNGIIEDDFDGAANGFE